MISITPPDVVPMINPRESDIGAEIIKWCTDDDYYFT
jgi:hypothetical protein